MVWSTIFHLSPHLPSPRASIIVPSCILVIHVRALRVVLSNNKKVFYYRNEGKKFFNKTTADRDYWA